MEEGPPGTARTNHEAVLHEARLVARDVARETVRAERGVPHWLHAARDENRLPALVAVLFAVVLQLLLPDRFGLAPRWIAPVVELVLLFALVMANPLRFSRPSRFARVGALVMVGVLTADNSISAVILDRDIVTGRTGEQAVGLLGAAAVIYLTNIVAFGIWFWEIDRGGPFARAAAKHPHPDFLFPQMSTPQVARPDWAPQFVDYLYVSVTNATAFSPTDTMPLTPVAKLLMTVQALVALSTTGLVVARAVNVLKS